MDPEGGEGEVPLREAVGERLTGNDGLSGID